jgi:hypothetical protein
MIFSLAPGSPKILLKKSFIIVLLSFQVWIMIECLNIKNFERLLINLLGAWYKSFRAIDIALFYRYI